MELKKSGCLNDWMSDLFLLDLSKFRSGSFLVTVNETYPPPLPHQFPDLVTLSGRFLISYKTYSANKLKPTEQKINGLETMDTAQLKPTKW